MNPCLVLCGAILLVASTVPDVGAQDTPASESKYFTMVGTIKFDKPDTPVIAQINDMDLDHAARWLITDRVGEQVLLFDSSGTLQASLDSSICQPGSEFNPEAARFVGQAFILVLNIFDNRGYRFTMDGNCLGPVDQDFLMPRYFDSDPAGNIYGAYAGPHREIRRMDATGRTLSAFPLPPSKFPNASRRIVGGGLVADGKHLYYASGPDSEILKFSLDGTLVQRIAARNRWFRTPNNDLPADASQFLLALRNWRSTGAAVLFELTAQYLMIQYTNRERGTGYQVFTKDGQLVAEEFGLNYLFSFGRDGLVYRSYQLGPDSTGELPNPYLEVYRFVAP